MTVPEYLRDVLIPDMHDSGSHATANVIDALVQMVQDRDEALGELAVCDLPDRFGEMYELEDEQGEQRWLITWMHR